MTPELWLAAGGIFCFAAFAALGSAVSRAAVPWTIDVRARALLGQGTIVAAFFTLTGRAYALTALASAAVVATIALHGSVLAAVAICACQVASQCIAELAKRGFRRRRPDDWIFHQELGFSYPSGHASTAALFFGSWLAYAAFAAPPHAAVATIVLLALWIAGIDWSRLALGAHYPTDVAGGTFFGCGWLALLWAALLHFGIVHPK